jgi:hypothetical protein
MINFVKETAIEVRPFSNIQFVSIELNIQIDEKKRYVPAY